MRMSSNFRNPCMIRSDVPLSNDQIAHYVPSIFAEEAHDSRSARYLYIPTVQVLDALRAESSLPRPGLSLHLVVARKRTAY